MYLERFPGKMPERRRQALAMLSAVDDGVGKIIAALARHDLTEKTLIFCIGDNGAPLKIHMQDLPGGGPGWDGSRNDPLNGEKGMLTEGGIHVPFIVAWPGKIPAGQVYEHPISALDVAATSLAAAGVKVPAEELDGVPLLPHLRGEKKTPPHEALHWRWIAQSAIREGKWKLLRGGEREYLFDLEADLEELHDLGKQHPEIASRLRTRLERWTDTLDPPGLTLGRLSPTWERYFDHYLDGKKVPAPGSNRRDRGDETPPDGKLQSWKARQASLAVEDGVLVVSGRESGKGSPLLIRTGIRARGPLRARLRLEVSRAGSLSIAWRTSTQRRFEKSHVRSLEISGGEGEQDVELELPVQGELIHLRVHLPPGTSRLHRIRLEPQSGTGAPVDLWKNEQE